MNLQDGGTEESLIGKMWVNWALKYVHGKKGAKPSRLSAMVIIELGANS